MVYARERDERTLTLLVSGKLWRNSLIMQDEETGTLWSHVTGEALDGPHKGESLETLPMVQSTWSKWKLAHPETDVLQKSTEVKSSRYEGYFSDPDRVGIFRSRYNEVRLPAKSRVFGLKDGLSALAVAESRLVADEPMSLVVGDVPVVLYRSSDGGARAYEASLDGVPLRFAYGKSSRSVRDDRTDSSWDLNRGVCVTGKYRGRKLQELQVLRAFWFAWSAFYPATELIDP